MSTLIIQESHINADKHYIYSQDSYPRTADKPSDMYSDYRREFGRCTGKVYVDMPNGKARQVGWVFVKRVEYDRSKDTYLREVWVTYKESEA